MKPITISAFIGTPNQAPTADNRIYKKIKDELGVTLNMEFLVGDLQQKLGVMIAGGEYPDLITADTEADRGQSGHSAGGLDRAICAELEEALRESIGTG